MAAPRLSFHDVQQAVISAVGKRQLTSIENGTVFKVPQTGKEYRLSVDSDHRIMVQRASAFSNQKVSLYKQLKHFFSDFFGTSTSSRLTKIFNDSYTQQVFSWLQRYNVSTVTTDIEDMVESMESSYQASAESFEASYDDFDTRKTAALLDSFHQHGNVKSECVGSTDSETEEQAIAGRRVRFAEHLEVFIFEPVVTTQYTCHQASGDLMSVFKAQNRGRTPRLIDPLDMA